ncbi:MAG: hypothetical protein Tsb005_06160 [Gammaproteobacteria bacterium]
MIKKYFIAIFFTVFALSACQSNTNYAPVEQARPISAKSRIYRVKPGDNLYAIAWLFDADYAELAQANDISPPYVLRVGQVIRAPRITTKKHRQVSATHKISRTKPHLPLSYRKNGRYNYQKGSQSTQGFYKKSNNGPISHWVWPARGKIIHAYASGGRITNKGIDIAGAYRSAIKAAADGVVVYSGSGLPSYGKLIIIKHNDDFLSAYAHNDRLLVHEGNQVKRGQKIAEMGKSDANQVKLHFEIRHNGKPVNPIHYLPRH